MKRGLLILMAIGVLFLIAGVLLMRTDGPAPEAKQTLPPARLPAKRKERPMIRSAQKSPFDQETNKRIGVTPSTTSTQVDKR